MFCFLATEASASFFNCRFKIGLEMNSASLASLATVAWNKFSSFSTFSKAFFFEAAEYRAEAYRPSKPKTWTGG